MMAVDVGFEDRAIMAFVDLTKAIRTFDGWLAENRYTKEELGQRWHHVAKAYHNWRAAHIPTRKPPKVKDKRHDAALERWVAATDKFQRTFYGPQHGAYKGTYHGVDPKIAAWLRRYWELRNIYRVRPESQRIKTNKNRAKRAKELGLNKTESAKTSKANYASSAKGLANKEKTKRERKEKDRARREANRLAEAEKVRVVCTQCPAAVKPGRKLCDPCLKASRVKYIKDNTPQRPVRLVGKK